MAGSMRTHTKGYYSSFILILLFSLTLFSCELFAPPQGQPDETEQEEIEWISPHPIVGYWSLDNQPDVIYHFTSVGGWSHKYGGGEYEIHDDRILIWNGSKYRNSPSKDLKLFIDGTYMRWNDNKYLPEIDLTFTRVSESEE